LKDQNDEMPQTCIFKTDLEKVEYFEQRTENNLSHKPAVGFFA
jgi:hypothetical protein